MKKFFRSVVVTGNWKMHKNISETTQFIKELAPRVRESSARILLAVPYTAIFSAAHEACKTNIEIGSQNLSDSEEGAFTGEISARMLKEAGAQFVIIGHSERRRFFHETNELVNKKIRRALHNHLLPTVCIGETLEQREAGKTNQVLQSQIEESLKGLMPQEVMKLILAYEPVWAIGTGKNASPEMAQEVHAFCREVLTRRWGQETAEKIVIQYGGSVKADNARTLLDQQDIDGLLVGGASLEIESFSKIINAQNVNITC